MMDNPTLPSEPNAPAVVKHQGPTKIKSRKELEGMVAGVGNISEMLAETRLQQAAREMLALLEDIAPYWEGTDSPLGERVRAVIAKVKGAG